ncbi:MAG: hypothetical protein LQ341_003263 [Variospora aurantia]|nr:MAG: hypothetical protein LQ341_003263 [Variospora aurantia]
MNSPVPSLTDLSSDLSSVGSLSPPLPSFDYPSPQSSQDQTSEISGSQQSCLKRFGEPTEIPLRKRRKIEPRPRTTEYLDLQAQYDPLCSNQQAQLDTLLGVLRKKKKIVVIAGAGISVSAGIPDFRSASGLFATLKNEHNLKASGKHLFDASVYQTDSSTSSFHTMVRGLSELASNAKPTAFHHLLATLGEQGRLMRLYTQNVDGIDTALTPLATSVPLATKGPWPRTIQLHGGLDKMVCSKCNHLSDFEPLLFNGPSPPPCTQCVEADKVRTDHAGKRSHGIGRLRPRMVLYNEHNPDDEAIGTVVGSDLRARPDAVIVVGTSMKIPGVRRIVREMCGVVRARRDGVAIWVNHDPPPVGKEFEECWDLIVKGSSDDVANTVKMRRWDDDGIVIKHCTESEAERAVQAKAIQVLIESARQDQVASMPTPAASPGLNPHPQQSKLGFNTLRHVEIPDRRIESSGTAPSKPPKVKAGAKSNPKHMKAKKAKPRPVDSGNTKINLAYYKVIKPTKLPLDDVKRKLSLSLLSEDELHKPMAPIPPHAARNNGLVPVPSRKLLASEVKVRRGISPEDLELRGPTKVVLAPVITKRDDIPSVTVTPISPIRSDVVVVSPTGRLPTGMAMLLH